MNPIFKLTAKPLYGLKNTALLVVLTLLGLLAQPLLAAKEQQSTQPNQVFCSQEGKKARHGRPEQQPSAYTPEQTAKVAEILRKYSPENLTAEDARAINNAFRVAGIRRGPGQSEAVKAAGFYPEKIRALDPPPAKKR